jgi:hypothetical protein
LTIAANPSEAWTGTVVIANATVRVNQSGAVAGAAPRGDVLGRMPVEAVTLTIAGQAFALTQAGPQ